MKILEDIKAWLSAKREARRKKQAALRAAALVRESEERIQAREFNGEVYLCYNNVPLVPADGLSWDIPTALVVARESWLKWKEKEAGYEAHR